MRLARVAAALPLALLLWGCPKDQDGQITVRVEGSRVVFDGDRSDCLARITVRNVPRQDVEGSYVWGIDSSHPYTRDGVCRLPFPVTYGVVPPRAEPNLIPTPPLEPGRRYWVYAEGGPRDYSAEFIAPPREPRPTPPADRPKPSPRSG